MLLKTAGVTNSPPKFLLSLLVLASLLFNHFFLGISHDAIFYAVQALFHLHPDLYGNDIFFLYGSQDDFTLFTSMYATLIDLLGFSSAMVTLFVTSYALWVSGTILLLGRLAQGFPLWLGLVLIFATPGYYATDTLLRYAEPFLTPRIVSEGLTLLSLAMLMSERQLVPLVLLLAAFTMHPLMALGGIGFTAFYLAKDNPKTVLTIAGVSLTLLILLACFEIAPFARLKTTMDNEWFELSFSRSPFIFWDGWKAADWNRVLFAFSLLFTAASSTQGHLRRVFFSALALGISGVALFWYGTSLTHNLLLIQLQLYRLLWLTQLFSCFSIAWLIDKFWGQDRNYRLLLLGFLTAWLMLDSIGGCLALLICTLFFLYPRNSKSIEVPLKITRLLCTIPLVAGLLSLLGSWQDSSVLYINATGTHTISVEFAIWWGLLLLTKSGWIIAGICFFGIWHWGSHRRNIFQLISAAGVLFLLEMSMVFWNRQDKWNRYYMQQIQHIPIPVFSRLIPEKATVYWEDNFKMTWFALGRASYTSHHQLAGIVFNRQTAIEGKRRMDQLAPLGTKDTNFSWISARSPDYKHPQEANFGALIHACLDPALDFVVLSKNFGEGVVAEHFEKISEKNFYLYDCTTLRQKFANSRKNTDASQW